MPPILVAEDVRVHYGAVEALKSVSLSLGEGDIVTVLGANGAGKTTLLKAISRILPLTGGVIKFKGEDMRKYPPFRLPSLGLAHVPEGRRIFSTLTVEENLQLGNYGVRDKMTPQDAEREMRRVYELFPILEERKRQLAGTLSGGEQQMLAIGRALVSRPQVMLLDEPSLGLAPLLVQEIFRVIEQIHRERGVSILLVEQNARKSLSVASYGYILETGKVHAEGKAKELAGDPRLRAAYLGGAAIKR